MTRRSPLFLLLVILSPLSGLAAKPAAPFTPLTGWYGVYMQGQKVGYAEMGQVLATYENRPAIDSYSRMSVNLSMLGQERHLDVNQSEYTDPDTLELLGIETHQATGLPGMDGDTRVRREGNELVIETLAGTEITGTRRVPYDAAQMNSAYGAAETVRQSIDPAQGGDVKLLVFESTLLKATQMEFSYSPLQDFYYNGVQERAYMVTTTIPELHITSTSYETEDGRTLKCDFLGGMMNVRLEDEAIAKSQNGVPDLMASSRVAVHGMAIPEQPVAHLELMPMLRDGGGDVEQRFATSARQRFEDHNGKRVLVIDMLGPGQGPAVTLSDAQHKEYLGGDLYVQPDNPRIKAKAAEILAAAGLAGGSHDDLARTYAIVRWVYRNLKKTIVPTDPNAAQVLEMMEGDCGEHAVLAAALLRASGIPAKVIIGMVYTPQYGGGFFYHAWNSALIDGHWLEVDAALGMFPADATHVKIGEGDDPGNEVGILQLYGQLQFEVERAVETQFEPKYALGKWN